MTEKNRQNNIREELARSVAAMGAADLLNANGYHNEAVSRLYYCLLYRVRALLLTMDLEPRSHEGALRLFSLHFVKNGPFAPASAHLFSKLMKYREEADDNPSYAFGAGDYGGLSAEVQTMSGEIERHLSAQALL